MSTPTLYLVLPCGKCGAAGGAPCLRADGKPRSRPHLRRTPPAPCGTYGGYQRHVKASEPTCPECREAARRYAAERRNAKPEEREADIALLRARRRATRRLIEQHRDAFDQLLAEERAR